jgi:hypothetical protein
VDTYSIAFSAPRVENYVARTAIYVATADTATLLFALTGAYVGDFALDAITLTVACTECGQSVDVNFRPMTYVYEIVPIRIVNVFSLNDVAQESC